MPPDPVFDLAFQHHQAGRLAEAEQLYRKILARQPNDARVLHLLGVLASQAGRPDAAVELIRRALAHNPDWPEALSNLGSILTGEGHIDEAVAACRRALVLKPDYAEALSNLGNALTDKGQLVEAIAVCRRAIALKPDYAEAWSNLGVALLDDEQFDGAIAACRQAISLKPEFPGAWNNLGMALKESGLLDEAVDACRRALSLNPQYPEALNNLGAALKEKGRLDEAIAAFRKASATRRRASGHKPAYSHARSNLGVTLIEDGHVDDAIAAFREIIQESPEMADAQHNLAIALLTQGNFSEGWSRYEWRWGVENFEKRPQFTQPKWDGSELNGRTLLIYPEQGFGDIIQFIRYVPLVAERKGGQVVIPCPPQLDRLLRSGPRAIRWIPSGVPLPQFDVHFPLMSLPLAFGTTLETIPCCVPYLKAAPAAIDHWRQRLGDRADTLRSAASSTGARPPLKVGLAWSGRPTHKNDRNRSLSLSAFAPLAELKGVRFYSLQKGDAATQAMNPPVGLRLTDWTNDLSDFADTAALIANLDLVISVDTAVAHLAGALAKPVWVLLPFVPDWRWLLKRYDSPWYPTMRLFRQPSAGDWKGAVDNVSEALRDI